MHHRSPLGFLNILLITVTFYRLCVRCHQAAASTTTNKTNVTTTTTTRTIFKYENGSARRYPRVDEIKDLKDSSYNRIIGGTRAPKGAYPWFTLTLVETYDGSLYYAGCGAILVAPEYVMTAAHCLEPLSGNTPVVFIGASCRSPNNCGEPSEILEVEKTIPHPDFEGDIHNDFALLKLNTRASASPVRMYVHF